MMMMRMMMWALVIIRGGTALPTKSHNDRPIIGILAQDVTGSLADALAKLAEEDSHFGIFDLNPDISSIVKRDLETTLQDLPEELEGQEELVGPTEEPESQEEYISNEVDTITGSPRESEIDSEQESTSEEPLERSQEGGLEEGLEGSEDQTSPSTPAVPPTTPPPIPKNASYIAASYVKFVEAGGARVVPIFINKEREYYENILKSINGVLFPGGAVAIDETSAFGRAGKIIFEIAKDMNDAGEVFPLWGTCLGFELMMGLAANGQEIRAECDAQNTANRLKLDADYADGYLFRHLPKRLIKSLTTERVTSNFHKYCLTPKNYTTFGVDKTYRVLAYSADRRGVEYIAAAEAWEYPFFAVQFHPEKSPYEWTNKPGHNHIPHSSIAIDTANHFAQVYVNYARRSKHRFATESEEANSLIYNFSPIYTGRYSFMEQIYVF